MGMRSDCKYHAPSATFFLANTTPPPSTLSHFICETKKCLPLAFALFSSTHLTQRKKEDFGKALVGYTALAGLVKYRHLHAR